MSLIIPLESLFFFAVLFRNKLDLQLSYCNGTPPPFTTMPADKPYKTLENMFLKASDLFYCLFVKREPSNTTAIYRQPSFRPEIRTVFGS
ncbi:MAG: hypothetical protein LBL58_06660 [Tannerellaceae bacterium]|jgi:hypothetical protein|nr:hypothetical protein [Tannerellaceae bacterium]